MQDRDGKTIEPGIYIAELETTVDLVLVGHANDDFIRIYSLYNSPGREVKGLVRFLDVIFDLNVAIPSLLNRLSQFVLDKR